MAADAFDQRGGVWSGADIEEGVEDGSLGVSQIFNGNGSNEGWRLERVKRQAGGEEKLDYVGSALWQTVDNIAVEDSNQQVRVDIGHQHVFHTLSQPHSLVHPPTVFPPSLLPPPSFRLPFCPLTRAPSPTLPHPTLINGKRLGKNHNIERFSGVQVRNVVLGEQRRVDAFKKEAEESMVRCRQAHFPHTYMREKSSKFSVLPTGRALGLIRSLSS